MKKHCFSVVSIFIFSIVTAQKNDEQLFIGFEKICWDTTKDGDCINSDTFDPKWKWYHQNYLKIRGDSVFFDQSPVSIHKKDTSYSASDGGFYYYSGTVVKLDSFMVANLTEVFCDYCSILNKKQPDGSLKPVKRKKDFKCFVTSDGLMIDDILYKRLNNNIHLRSEYPPPGNQKHKNKKINTFQMQTEKKYK